MKIFVTIITSFLVSLLCVAAALLAYDFLIFRANRRADLARENQGEGLEEINIIELGKEYINQLVSKQEFAINRFVVDEKLFNERIDSSKITRIAFNPIDLRAFINSQDTSVAIEIETHPEPFFGVNKKSADATIENLEKFGIKTGDSIFGTIRSYFKDDIIINRDVINVRTIKQGDGGNRVSEILAGGFSDYIFVKNDGPSLYGFYSDTNGMVEYFPQNFQDGLLYVQNFGHLIIDKIKQSEQRASEYLGYDYKIKYPIPVIRPGTEESYLETQTFKLI